MNTKANLLKTLIREEVRKQLGNRRLNEDEDMYMYSGKSSGTADTTDDPDLAIYPSNPEKNIFKGLKALGKSNLMRLKRSMNIVANEIPQRMWGTNSGAGIRFEAPTGDPANDWGTNPNIILFLPSLTPGSTLTKNNIDFGSVKSYYNGKPRKQQFIITGDQRYSDDLESMARFLKIVDKAIAYTPIP